MTHVMIDKGQLKEILEALRISLDSVKSEAEYYRSTMGPYRPYRQKQLDDDVKTIERAIKYLAFMAE